MADLIFNLLVRRSGQGFHDSDKFTVQEFTNSKGEIDIDRLKDAVCHYIDVQLEDEETNGGEYDERNEGDDES